MKYLQIIWFHVCSPWPPTLRGGRVSSLNLILCDLEAGCSLLILTPPARDSPDSPVTPPVGGVRAASSFGAEVHLSAHHPIHCPSNELAIINTWSGSHTHGRHVVYRTQICHAQVASEGLAPESGRGPNSGRNSPLSVSEGGGFPP